MSVRRLKRIHIDTKKWDLAIENSYQPLMYGLSWYLDTVSPNWEALIYGDYQVIMPLPIKSTFGISRILQPPFTQQLGVFSKTELSEKALANFLKYLPKLSIKTDLHFHNTAQISGSTLRNNYLLSLSPHYEELYKKYNQNTKRNLKRASENDFKITESNSAKLMVDAFKKGTGAKLGIDKEFYEEFERLCKNAKNKIEVCFYDCMLYQDFAAGICIFSYQGRSILLFSSASNIGKSTGAMHFLIDWYIKKNAGKGGCLDFEGSDLSSLAQFYKGFGSSLFTYQRFKKGFI